jgi:translation initiation factor 3 subunit D
VKFEDICWCGDLRQYNKDFDKITTRAEKVIKKYEDVEFFNHPSTTTDPKLGELLESDEEISVIATDPVLACLVAAARSQYSWDLVVTTMSENGRKVMIIDKREASPINFLTVNETATNNQNVEENDRLKDINSINNLCQEASCINQNFSQFLLTGPKEEMDEPNPFAEDDADVASGAVRYRKITIPGNPKDSSEAKQQPIVLAVRTEVNCRMPGHDEQYASIKALNEYDPKPNYSWRKLLQSQHGMVMATELKNNAYKLGRWTAEAILAGCDVMKIGYATRNSPNDQWYHSSHSLLAVQTFMTNNFADQIGMHRNNMFGIIRNIVDLVMEWDDGKYLILKDPMKPILRLYEVPWSFGEEDDLDEEDLEEDDGPELDEEGNPAPLQAIGPNLG